MASTPNKSSLRIIVLLVVQLAVFLLGFIPQWRKAREQSTAHEKAEHALTLNRIVNYLGSAAIDARRGEYEAARVEGSVGRRESDEARMNSPACSSIVMVIGYRPPRFEVPAQPAPR
jgi:hypothetical protein